MVDEMLFTVRKVPAATEFRRGYRPGSKVTMGVMHNTVARDPKHLHHLREDAFFVPFMNLVGHQILAAGRDRSEESILPLGYQVGDRFALSLCRLRGRIDALLRKFLP